MGIIERISGPLVVARDMLGSNMYDVVKVGDKKLIGEIIQLKVDKAVIQVYEDTTGLRPGEAVVSTNKPLSVELGPGLLGNIYDGIQRPLEILEKKTGVFIGKGIEADPIDKKKKWKFVIEKGVKKGMGVHEGEILGYVQETELLKHYIMMPIGVNGKLEMIKEGNFAVNDVIAKVKSQRQTIEITMAQKRAVRRAAHFKTKFASSVPLITGQRVIDTLFPVAKGGTAAIPGPFGSGKCVVGETKIFVNNELKEIKAVFDSSEGKEGKLSENEIVKKLSVPLEIYTFNGTRIEPVKIDELYKGKTSSLVEVKTRSGRKVRLTPIHKLFVLDDKLRVVEKEAHNIKPGEYIISPRKMAVDAVYQKITANQKHRVVDPECIDKVISALDKYLAKANMTKKVLAEKLNMNYKVLLYYYTKTNLPTVEFVSKIEKLTGERFSIRHVKTERHSAQIKTIDYINEDFAELLGLLMSDGMIRGRSQVVFFNNDPELLNRAKFLLKELFGLEAKEQYQRTVNSVVVSSSALVDVLKGLGYPTKKKSRNVSIPKEILASPDSVLIKFFEGYVNGDGYMGKGGMEITSASKAMRDSMCYLLLRLGILSKTAEKHVKGWTYYRIFISPKEASKIYPEYQKEHYFNSTDVVPMNTELFAQILAGTKPYALEKKGIETAGYYVNQNFTVQTFKKVISELGESYLANFSKSLEYVFCDEVREINFSDKETDVYDLVVPDTHNFIGGDMPMVLHNTVTQQSLAKYCDADIIIYVGCGERGNEMTEVLTEFPGLKDPKTGKPLMERTVLVANTSNMPVAAREASIYTGVTIAEYFRDMGYDVAVMADSTSRWAEAMREISARLEELPGEEGYPAYLPKRLAEYYERSGATESLADKRGSITLIGAVSPAGGDISEPVSQGTLRVAKTFWALDASLASSRHFPSINWLNSYSLYNEALEQWYSKNVGEIFVKNKKETMKLLQREAELKDIVQLVGEDALPDSERIVLDVGRIIREGYLRQNAYDEVDAYTSLKKQNLMLDTILYFSNKANEAVQREVSADKIIGMKVKTEIARLKASKESEIEAVIKKVRQNIDSEFEALVKEHETVFVEEKK